MKQIQYLAITGSNETQSGKYGITIKQLVEC